MALAGLIALGGCSTSQPTSDRARGIDAEQFYRDYDEQTAGDTARSYGTQAMPNATSGATPTSRPPGDTVPLPPPLPPGPPRPPGPGEDNTFVDAGMSGFVDTTKDALSTFGLDVDTGSFRVAKTLLSGRKSLPAAAIRSEEWVNAQTYTDPLPTDKDLAVSTETGASPMRTDGTQLVRVAIRARAVTAAQRPRVNVTMVVDRSGSMDIRNRLGLVRSSLALLADRLADDDTVSVVSFEDEATPILEPTKVSDTDAILHAINRLEPGGSTNLEAGLRLGYKQARAAYDKNAVNLVVLASDGVANVGDTGPDSISATIAEEGAKGIHLVTVGYGMGNYNDNLMEQLADLGDGFYSYVDDFAEAERLFGTDLTTTLTPVAAEARAQVSFDPERVTSYRLIGYDNRAIADDDFTNMDVDAGELGAGHRSTALYEVRLAPGVDPGAQIGTAAIQWKDTATGRTSKANAPVVAARESVPSDNFALAALTANLAETLKADPYAERPQVALADLARRAETLRARDIPGAADLAEMITAARHTS